MRAACTMTENKSEQEPPICQERHVPKLEAREVNGARLALTPLEKSPSKIFFDQVGHETMYAYIANEHFFTKSCHRQTYQNYEQSRQKLGTFLENKVL